MKKIISFLMSNPIIYGLLSLLTYVFYGIVIGISLSPSVYLIYKLIGVLDFSNLLHIFLFSLSIGVAIYLFFIVSLLVFGVFERILITGFKPGRYSVDSPLFARWLIYSGLHIILLYMVLPFMSGTPFAKMFYRMLGCKIGKNVFLNTRGLHDSYLLEIGDDVVIGAETNVSCHIFEGRELILDKIKIEKETLIGTQCYIMPGVNVGEHSSVGLYSYIRKGKNVEPNSMIMAMPGLSARKIAELSKERKTTKEESTL